jgi:hypothetical protein
MKRALCICVEDETQKWLSVSGVVLMEKTMSVMAAVKTVS